MTYSAEIDVPDFNDPVVRGRVMALGELAIELLIERDRLMTQVVDARPTPPEKGE